jgi:hypothetical protein
VNRARIALALGLVALACSAGGGTEPGNGSSGSGAASNGAQSGTIAIGSGGSAGTTSISVGGATNGTDCPTTLSGVVYDPAGKLPLYNVVVYVPSTELSPIASGAACETCDGNFSGTPLAAALSDAAGHFTMEKVPPGANVPVVIQIGKWRRQITIPSVTACTDNPIDDPELLRLPRNQGEGDLPSIAVVRGGSDALECLIRKIGVDDAEFTTDAETGKVHLYASMTGSATEGTGQLSAGATLGAADSLFDSLDKLMAYDMLLLGCEGTDNAIAGRSLQQFLNVRTYADQGGRVFGSHYNNQFIYWQEHTEANPYPDVVKFASGAHGFGVDVTGTVNTSFPKGLALSEWLTNIGASATPGTISIKDGEHTVDSILHASAQDWITTNDDPNHPGGNVVQYFSFPTPIDGAVCGRMVFSDIHVSAGSGDSGKAAFPDGCTSSELSPQEAALAFMIFDLSSCVQPEDEEVVPPVVK